MTMYMFDTVCVTARKLCKEPIENRVYSLLNSGIDRVILREKDLNETDYTALAERVLKKCGYSEKISLHYYPQACEKLNHKYLHISIPILLQNRYIKNGIKKLGVSVHSVDEAVLAESLGVDYVTAGHIFPTECKKGVPARGLEFLTSVCKNVEIPVYAIGGINETNIELIKNSGASGACIMSGFMGENLPSLITPQSAGAD